MKPLRAELLKLGTLPAIPLAAALTVAGTLLLALATAAAGRGQPLGPDPVLTPLRYAQAGFLVLGVLAAASEYRHGTIRTTLVAMPRRFSLQLAKAAALTAVAGPVAAVTVAAALTALADTLPIADAAGAAAHLTACALIGSAIALTVRQATAATALALGAYFVAGPLLRAATDLGRYLPDAAATDPAGGVLASGAWAVATLAVASWLFLARDG